MLSCLQTKECQRCMAIIALQAVRGQHDYHASETECAVGIYFVYTWSDSQERPGISQLSPEYKRNEGNCRLLFNHGFNIVVQHYQSKTVPPPHEYDIIFGLEPNFVLCAEKHPDAKTVYYATGAYVGYANRSIVQRTSQFNTDMAQTYRPADWLWMTAVQGRVTVSCKSARQIL